MTNVLDAIWPQLNAKTATAEPDLTVYQLMSANKDAIQKVNCTNAAGSLVPQHV